MLQMSSDTVTQDYSGTEWSNINAFWYWYGKYISIADAGNGN